MSRKVLLPLSLVIAQIANLLTQVVIAQLLEPGEFTSFALSWAYGQFALVLCFEWLRVAAIRFSDGANAWVARSRRLALKRNYMLVSALLCLLAITGAALGVAWPLFSLLAIACVFAICRGAFDGGQAFSRAMAFDRQFVIAWSVSSVLSLVVTTVAAALTGSGEMAALGLALSYAATLVVTNAKSRFGKARVPKVHQTQSRFLFRYGAFVALTGAVSAAIGPSVRSFAVAGSGPESAAGLLLALDLTQKVVGAVGMVMNVFLLQRAIKTAESRSHDLPEKLGRQIALVALAIAPVGIGFALLQPGIGQIFVPTGYRSSFLECIVAASLCAVLISFRSYAIDTQFVVAGKPRSSVFGPLSTLVASSVWILLGSESNGFSLSLVTNGLLFGAVLGVVVAACLARRVLTIRWPIRDLLAIVLACCAMIAIAWAIPVGGGVTSIGALGACGLTYLLLVWLMDVGSIRSNRLWLMEA